MKNVIRYAGFCALTVSLSALSFADEEKSAPTIAGWRVSAGGNIGFGLKANMRVSPFGIPAATAKAGAMSALTPVPGGSRVDYGGGAFIDPSSSSGDPNKTWNWKLPASSAVGAGGYVEAFRMEQSWVGYQTGSAAPGVYSDDGVCYGASIDFSRLLYAAEDGKWGVDLAIGLQYLKSDEFFKDNGGSCNVQSGTEYVEIRTDGPLVEPYPGAPGYTPDGSGLYGLGQHSPGELFRPTVLLDGGSVVHGTSSQSVGLFSRGDYEEWEISLLLRPWYDLFDWWRLRAALGLGVTRSQFDFAMNAALNGATIYSSSEEFHEWRCYGLVGVGTCFRYKEFDLGVDCLYRFCQDDMDVNGRDCSGTLEKPDLHLRISLGCSF